jgi:hypothetical protein
VQRVSKFKQGAKQNDYGFVKHREQFRGCLPGGVVCRS